VQATNGSALVDIPVDEGLVDEKVTKNQHLIDANEVKEALKNADLTICGIEFKDEGVFFKQRTGDYFKCEQHGDKRWPDLSEYKALLDPNLTHYPYTYVFRGWDFTDVLRTEDFIEFLDSLRSTDSLQSLLLVFDHKEEECSLAWSLESQISSGRAFYGKMLFRMTKHDKPKYAVAQGDLFVFGVNPILLKKIWDLIKPTSHYSRPEICITPVSTTSSEAEGITVYEGALRISASEYDDRIILMMPLNLTGGDKDHLQSVVKRVKHILHITENIA